LCSPISSLLTSKLGTTDAHVVEVRGDLVCSSCRPWACE
jgi:hypothetical protein